MFIKNEIYLKECSEKPNPKEYLYHSDGLRNSFNQKKKKKNKDSFYKDIMKLYSKPHSLTCLPVLLLFNS